MRHLLAILLCIAPAQRALAQSNSPLFTPPATNLLTLANYEAFAYGRAEQLTRHARQLGYTGHPRGYALHLVGSIALMAAGAFALMKAVERASDDARESRKMTNVLWAVAPIGILGGTPWLVWAQLASPAPSAEQRVVLERRDYWLGEYERTRRQRAASEHADARAEAAGRALGPRVERLHSERPPSPL